MKIKSEQGGIFAFMLIFANTGFVGIPVINALYGKEAVFYASITEGDAMPISNIYLRIVILIQG
ncbi:MAG: AEC family transporter [Clostridiaceae bacterium]